MNKTRAATQAMANLPKTNRPPQRPFETAAPRESSAKRGYGPRWQRYRKFFLQNNPFCVACTRLGKITVAEEVDHIVPVLSASDPNFWASSNHQPLCSLCHKVKTATDIRQRLTRRTGEGGSNL